MIGNILVAHGMRKGNQNEALEEFKQKAQRFENICFFNGISLQFGLSDKVIKFDK